MSEVDVLILGGGPAGSTAATHLARAGKRVLLCERERFPRFHIGESLLPYNVPVFERLGVWDKLLAHGFQRKWGARFVFEPSMTQTELHFPRGLDRAYPMSLQVRRAALDQILLDNAAEHGAEIRQATEVRRVHFDGDRATGATLRDESGRSDDVTARAVIDASGRDGVLGKQLGLRRRDPALRQAALFGHFECTARIGKEGGDILVVGGPYGWFWLIPLDERVLSVGCVMPGHVMASRRGDDLQAFFDDLVARSPTVAKQLAGARPVRPVEATADFSYRMRRVSGDGWALAGDAAAFLDPVFSSGVYLAMRTGERAAREIDRALDRNGRVDAADLDRYSRFVLRGLDRFRRYILAFYDPAGAELFASGPPWFLRAATVSAFAGKVFERDPRIWLFNQVFFGNVAWRHHQARAGRRQLSAAPAHDVVADTVHEPVPA